MKKKKESAFKKNDVVYVGENKGKIEQPYAYYSDIIFDTGILQRLPNEFISFTPYKINANQVRPFEDGDILFYPQKVYNKTTFLIQIKGYLFYNEYQDRVFYRSAPGLEGDKRYLANEEQKQLLFYRLAKDGKRWNAETKQLEDLNEPIIGEYCIFWDNFSAYDQSIRIEKLEGINNNDAFPYYTYLDKFENCILWDGTKEQFDRVRNGGNK